MTEYTETKRALQKIDYYVKKRLGEKDIIMSDGCTDIRLIDTECGLYYAASRNNKPISFHNKAIPGEEVWWGYNYEIDKTTFIRDLYDVELCHILGSVAHMGHHCADMELIKF